MRTFSASRFMPKQLTPETLIKKDIKRYKECLICNKSFYVKPSHFKKRVTCSMKCLCEYRRIYFKGENNSHWKGGNVQKECPACGKKFYVCLSLAETRKYCSLECCDKSKVTHGRTTKQAKKYRLIIRQLKEILNTKKCTVCGKSFIVKPGELLKRTYCNIDCYRKAQAVIKKEINCISCGKIFQAYPHLTNRKYCSFECRIKSLSLNGNPNWKNGIKALNPAEYARISVKIRNSLKKAQGDGFSVTDVLNILKNQQYRCAICSKKINKTGYHIDHIHPISKGGLHSNQNIQVLCQSCNLHKSNKLPHKYMQELGYLL